MPHLFDRLKIWLIFIFIFEFWESWIELMYNDYKTSIVINWLRVKWQYFEIVTSSVCNSKVMSDRDKLCIKKLEKERITWTGLNNELLKSPISSILQGLHNRETQRVK